MSNLDIWNELCETDPKYTKEFSRPGGFKGTAQNPTYVIRKLTEKFGPCGKGWGFSKPEFVFQSVNDGQVLVFCTITGWYENEAQTVHGVGGDFAIGSNKFGLKADDEGCKKAFTDALGNAFKFIGVGADLFLGMFDDSKYVNDLKAKFGEEKPSLIKQTQKPDAEVSFKAAKSWVSEHVNEMKLSGTIDNLELLINNNHDKRERIKQSYPELWEGIEHEENSIREGGFEAKPKVKFASVKDAQDAEDRMTAAILKCQTQQELKEWHQKAMPYLVELDRVLSAEKYLEDGKTPKEQIEAKIDFRYKSFFANQL